jgi:SAM-dependent methyltransferase
MSSTLESKPTQINPFNLGLKDQVKSGWYGKENGELVKGFCIKPEDTILDAGCGTGGQALYAAKTGAHVILLDIDASRVTEAMERLKDTPARKVDTIVSDSNPIDLPDASVTKVMSSEVIEHVDDPKRFLEELVRVGAPGAQYLLACPDPTSEHFLEEIAPDFYFQKPNHIRVIQREEFRAMVEDAGLIIEEHIFYGSFWTIWWMLYWTYEDTLDSPWGEMTDAWTTIWGTLLQTDGGLKVKHAMDQAIPKSQVLIARKPY